MNRSKAKGTAFETEVVKIFHDWDFAQAERRSLKGSKDAGDIAGVSDWAFEVKNCKQMCLAGWMEELVVEMNNAGVPYGAVIHKRVRKSAQRAYVTMELDCFLEFLREHENREYRPPIAAI